MPELVSEDVQRFITLVGPEPDRIQREMQDHAADESFPIIGPEVGGLLRLIARLVDAQRVFEFGSGFGYSGSWFAGALPTDGELVMTEIDEGEVDLGREFFERADYPPGYVFEHGDALDVVERYDGPFDVALIDHQKHRYVEGFEAAKRRLAPGGAVIADNMMRGPLDFEDVLAGLEDEYDGNDESTLGVIHYLGHVRDDPDFETTVIPMGSGIALSVNTA